MDTNKRRFESLLIELRSGNDDQRRFAALELGSSENPDAIPHLEAALEDPAPLVRVAAVVSLAKLGSLGSVPKLVLALEDQGPMWANLRECSLEKLLLGCRTSEEAGRFMKLLAQGSMSIEKDARPESRRSMERISAMAKHRYDALLSGELMCKKPEPPKQACKPRRKRVLPT